MSDFEKLFEMPLPKSHGAESKSKPLKKSEPSKNKAGSHPELWFWRGSMLGMAMTVGLFTVGDHLGLHRREAVENGTRALLTEWIEANPKITAAEVLNSVRSGVQSPPQSRTSDASHAPSVSTSK